MHIRNIPGGLLYKTDGVPVGNFSKNILKIPESRLTGVWLAQIDFYPISYIALKECSRILRLFALNFGTNIHIRDQLS